MHSEHDAITLGAALLLWFVGLVAIGIAVLARMGRFTERPVEFADYATWLAAGLSVGAASSHLAIISELFTADGAEGVLRDRRVGTSRLGAARHSAMDSS
jgi:hypothetical protein